MLVPRAPPRGLRRQLATRLTLKSETPPTSRALGRITRSLAAEPPAGRLTHLTVAGRARWE